MTTKNDGEKWIVYKFVFYNHELLTPRSTGLLCGYRQVTPTLKNVIKMFNESRIPTQTIMSVSSKKSSGDFSMKLLS